MSMRSSSPWWILPFLVLLAAPVAAQEPVLADHDPTAALEELRHATERYRDVEAALADGYVRDPAGMCVMAETEGWPRQLGGMGVHYFRPDRLGITATAPVVDGTGVHTDFREPGVLVYMPDARGEMELVAIENIVFAEAWHAAGHRGRPTFLGREYYHMVENPETPVLEAHGFAPHYELHLWIHRENPAGVFAQFHPELACPGTRPDRTAGR